MHAHDTANPYQNEINTTIRLAAWTLAWTGTLALARFGPSHFWDAVFLGWVAVGLNVAAGLGWILAHKRLLDAVDELQRKVWLDAMAIALGAGWIVGFAYVAADSAGLVTRDLDAGLLPMLMAAVYIGAIAFGNLRYR